LILPGGDPWHLLFSMWQRYDALWYQQIATHGYAAGDSTVAFYPLYPLLSHVTSLLFGGQIVVAELLVSSVAFAVGMWLLYKVARLDAGPFAAQLVILLTAFFPVGFFLLAPSPKASTWCCHSPPSGSRAMGGPGQPVSPALPPDSRVSREYFWSYRSPTSMYASADARATDSSASTVST
jgi:hypothetical protein